MDFKNFETEFFLDLKKKNNNKKCLNKISKNGDIILENLGENANFDTIKKFVDGINNIIISKQKI